MLTKLIFLLCLLLAGYFAGRRTGLVEGARHGLKVARLELLGESLDLGECLLCRRKFSREEEYSINTQQAAVTDSSGSDNNC
ncbi:MAG: hypothetical protein KGZ79_13825 [Dethiobacter sp.]|jgi:hypothetical protein|nr:hypothetical protein [Dethiobacter sp.]